MDKKIESKCKVILQQINQLSDELLRLTFGDAVSPYNNANNSGDGQHPLVFLAAAHLKQVVDEINSMQSAMYHEGSGKSSMLSAPARRFVRSNRAKLRANPYIKQADRITKRSSATQKRNTRLVKNLKVK